MFSILLFGELSVWSNKDWNISERRILKQLFLWAKKLVHYMILGVARSTSAVIPGDEARKQCDIPRGSGTPMLAHSAIDST
jgi:hypothetical protein